MPYNQGFAALLVIVLQWDAFVEAKPTLDFPINSQVPPVARESQEYNFIFSASTFGSSNGSISYKLSEQPSWLQLQNETRLLSGIPDEGSSGATTFNLLATDNEGSTMSSVTLVILASTGPQVGDPLLPQLAKVGQTSSPASLLLQPLQPFSFTFTTEVFTNTGSETIFYAISANNTPLPPWVQFESSVLQFSGTAPPLVSATAPPQTYGIKLIASDVAGFAEADVEFQIIIGYHILASTETTQKINITAERTFASTPMRNTLTLDGKLATDADLVSVACDGPKWVELDASTISIKGIPPVGVVSTEVLVVLEDIYGDIFNATITLETGDLSVGNFFTGDIQDFNVTRGDKFIYQIGPELLVESGIQLSADLGNASSWLHFSPRNRTLYGDVLEDITPGPESITLTASNGKDSEERTFDINVLRSNDSLTTSVGKTSPTMTASSSPANVTIPAKGGLNALHPTREHIILIVLAVVIPILLVAMSLLVILHCRRRRKHRREAERQMIPPDELESQPEVSATPQQAVGEAPLVAVTTSDRIARHDVQPGPPQIDLPWAPDSLRTSKDRLSKRLQAKKSGSVASSWQDYFISNDNLFRITPPIPAVINNVDVNVSEDDIASLRAVAPNYSWKRKPSGLNAPQRQESVVEASLTRAASRRASKTLSGISQLSVGLPQRLSGAGHGMGGLASSCFNEQRSSWQTMNTLMIPMDSRGSMIILDKFPSPPDRDDRRVLKSSSRDSRRATVLQPRSPNRPANTTLRLVRRDSSEASSLEVQRQKWYTERARDPLEAPARFSSASSGTGGRPISTGLLSDTKSWRNTQNSWSRWSGIGPAGRVESSLSQRSPGKVFVRTSSRLRREPSTTSSGQFNSALSSDSQWEDENLIEEENAGGLRQWQTSSGREQDTPSPRMPFESPLGDQENVEVGGRPLAPPRRVRLADSIKTVNVDLTDMKRSEKSQQGSLAFI